MDAQTVARAEPGCDHADVGPEEQDAPIGWWTAASGAAVAAVSAVALLRLAQAEADVPAAIYVSDVLFPVAWTVNGLVAWRLRPGSHVGILMVAFGVALFASAPFGWLLPTDLPLRWLVTAAGVVGFWAGLVLAGKLLLTYPSGRPADRVETLFLRCAYVSAVVVAVGHLLVLAPDRSSCRDRCHVSPIQAISDHGLSFAWWRLSAAWFLVLAAVCLGLLARRAARGGRRWRKQRAVIAVASIAVVAGGGSFLLLSAAGQSAEETWWLAYPTLYLSLLVVPGAFLVGLLRDRVGYASVADLVRGLGDFAPGDLQAGLARTLQDPSLMLVFPVGEGGDFVDLEGRGVDLPEDASRTVTMLGPADDPVAALVHDRVLSESPKLLEAAGAAANLALQNARLQAEVRAQLAEVRASRARIVAAADEERQRLERNLHDGAQQRLLGIGMTLHMLRSELDGRGSAARFLDEAEAELRSAIQEVRDLAQGIHPAVLTDEGLLAGVGLLTRRSPVPVTVDARLDERPSPHVEAAAYFIISEALQNVAKHSGAQRATVRLRRHDGRLDIRVVDDGLGGASIRGGSGVRGMADRALALDGTFDILSSPGEGTEVRVDLPCD